MNPDPLWADPTTPWEPLSVAQVSAMFTGHRFPWWIGGGWAIDLFLGYQSRRHDDTDVVVLRDHLECVRGVLEGWQLYAADPPGTLRLWQGGETLPVPIHDIWCRRRGDSEAWALQLMVVEATGADWMYRRDHRIRRPLAGIGLVGPDNVPFLKPEIQLLFKSKNPRPKDQADFDNTIPQLDEISRRWLAGALATSHPGHPWLAVLG